MTKRTMGIAVIGLVVWQSWITDPADVSQPTPDASSSSSETASFPLELSLKLTDYHHEETAGGVVEVPSRGALSATLQVCNRGHEPLADVRIDGASGFLSSEHAARTIAASDCVDFPLQLRGPLVGFESRRVRLIQGPSRKVLGTAELLLHASLKTPHVLPQTLLQRMQFAEGDQTTRDVLIAVIEKAADHPWLTGLSLPEGALVEVASWTMRERQLSDSKYVQRDYLATLRLRSQSTGWDRCDGMLMVHRDATVPPPAVALQTEVLPSIPGSNPARHPIVQRQPAVPSGTDAPNRTLAGWSDVSELLDPSPMPGSDSKPAVDGCRMPGCSGAA
jgi:hypothetical protein